MYFLYLAYRKENKSMCKVQHVVGHPKKYTHYHLNILPHFIHLEVHILHLSFLYIFPDPHLLHLCAL